MPVERAHVAVESLIAEHVALSFRQNDRGGTIEGMAAQIRSRITDRLQHNAVGSEQDNAPPALLTLRNTLVTAFPPAPTLDAAQDRTEKLALLQVSLAELRRQAPLRSMAPHDGPPGKPLDVDLLLERQQLVLKNEFTEGFGRVETWLVSIAALALVLLRAIDFLWALPILMLGIGRAFSLDRQCRKRMTRIAEIDAIMEPARPPSHI